LVLHPQFVLALIEYGVDIGILRVLRGLEFTFVYLFGVVLGQAYEDGQPNAQLSNMIPISRGLSLRLSSQPNYFQLRHIFGDKKYSWELSS